MRNRNYYYHPIIASLLCVLATFVCGAQINGGEQFPPPPLPQGAPPPDGLPIDTGLVFLFAAALIYGVYKIVMFSNKKMTP